MSLSQSFSQKIGNVRPLNPCPSLDIDFVNGGYVNDLGFANQASVGSANFNIGSFNGTDPTFTRASAATFRGSNGLIQYAPENLLSYSQQFDDPSWVKSSLNVTGTPAWVNVEIAPNGTQTADAIFANGLNAPHYLFPGSRTWQPILHSFSCYMKAATNQYGWLGCFDGTTSYQSIFDLQSGIYIGNALGSGPVNASISNAGNGWWRCSILFTPANATANFSSQIGTKNSSGLALADSSSGGIYIWGAQLERHSSARPYISTTSAARYGPRFEYDTNGNPLGLLMEEQSTNLVYPSATLTTQTRTVTAAPHTLSFYGTGSVSLSGATIGTVIGSGSNTRTVYTFTPTAGSLTLTVSGSVTLAQLEQKPFATSYIPTVGGSATRNADTVNSTIGSWYNADEGTIVVKGDRTGFNVQDSLFELTSGTTASLAHRGDGTDENFLVEDAATAVTIVETIPLNSPLYFAASYSDPATQVNATVNAEPVQGTTLASTITTPTTLNIAYSPEISTYFNGHIKAFRYYAKALPSKLEFFTLTA